MTVAQITEEETIILLRGTNAEDVEFYAYVSATPENVKRMNDDYENGRLVNFSNYGTVLLSGMGEPTEYDKIEMAERFGFVEFLQ